MTAARLEEVLYEARSRAFPPGEFVGQESFVTAGEVLALARRAGIDRATRVLDLCCGRGGPGLHIVERLGCAYAGVLNQPSFLIPGGVKSVGRANELAFS